jgi:hypothetical protein
MSHKNWKDREVAQERAQDKDIGRVEDANKQDDVRDTDQETRLKAVEAAIAAGGTGVQRS